VPRGVLTLAGFECHSVNVTLFNFTLQRGTPIAEQLVHAALRAILRGEYLPEQPFPSVRAIAASLKIHPNTAHKAVQTLIEERWLEVRAGVGTVVTSRPRPRGGERGIIRDDVDRLALKARVNELSLADVTDELRSRWKQLEPAAKA